RRHHNVYPITHSIVNDIVSDLTSGDIGVLPTGDTATGSASVVVTASGVGASLAVSDGLASVTISAVAGGEDASGSTAAGSAAIVISASGDGASTAAAAGAIAGTATLSGTGASTAAAAGTIAGTATLSGDGASTAAAAGTIAGTATLAAISENTSAERNEGHDATFVYPTTADYYVDQATGDDGNDGTSTGAAFKTIQAALDAADGDGDVSIAVRAGTYREALNFNGLVFSTKCRLH